jgi:acyl carrier protein
MTTFEPDPGPQTLNPSDFQLATPVSTSTTEERVTQLLSRMLGHPAEDFQPETDLVQDLGISSVDLFGLVAAIEEEFDLVFPAEDADLVNNVRTVEDVVNLVEEYQE